MPIVAASTAFLALPPVIYMPLSRDLAFCECSEKNAVQVWGVGNIFEPLGVARRVLSCGVWRLMGARRCCVCSSSLGGDEEFLIGHSQVRFRAVSSECLFALDFSKAAAPRKTRRRFDAEARETRV